MLTLPPGAGLPMLCIDLTQILWNHHLASLSGDSGTGAGSADSNASKSPTKRRRIVLGTGAAGTEPTSGNLSAEEKVSRMKNMHMSHISWCNSSAICGHGQAYLACGGQNFLHLLSVGES